MAQRKWTEEEWMAGRDGYWMLRPCRKIIRYQPRKGRLFAVACCRRIWQLLEDQRSRDAVVVAEHFAEGLVGASELQLAEENARIAHAEAFRRKGKVGACGEWAAQYAATPDAWKAAENASNFAYVAAGDPVSDPGPEKAVQADLARCIFGPLAFRPITIDPAWLSWNDNTVRRIAQRIYDERKFEDMPVLADALEESGCSNQEVLEHCRGPGPHVRGCWVLDSILGKL